MNDNGPMSLRDRLQATIAQRAAKRGRYLTAKEQLDNLASALADEDTPRERWLCRFLGHRFHLRWTDKPDGLICRRCGTTAPTPYGDQRIPYL